MLHAIFYMLHALAPTHIGMDGTEAKYFWRHGESKHQGQDCALIASWGTNFHVDTEYSERTKKNRTQPKLKKNVIPYSREG